MESESKTVGEAFRVACALDGESEGTPISWHEFAAVNEAIGDELADVLATVSRGDVYRGGGGAAPGFTVRKVSR